MFNPTHLLGRSTSFACPLREAACPPLTASAERSVHRASRPHAIPTRPLQLQGKRGATQQLRAYAGAGWEQLAREQGQGKNWWQEHKDVILDVRTAAQWSEELAAGKPDETLVVEWVSPTCKHCLAAQGTVVLAIEAVKEATLPVKFLRVACDDTDTKTLARAHQIRAFPTISMHRAGAKLIDFNPSQRGDAIGRLIRNIEVVATTLDPTKGFQMLSNEVKVVELGPTELSAIDKARAAIAEAKAAAPAAAAVAVAAAVPAVAAAVPAVPAAAPEADAEEGAGGGCDEEEECAPAWETES